MFMIRSKLCILFFSAAVSEVILSLLCFVRLQMLISFFGGVVLVRLGSAKFLHCEFSFLP